VYHLDLKEINDETLKGLIGNEREGKRIEYKRELPGKTEEDKAEFLKDITAFANTEGGDIVYGMADVKGVASAFMPIENSRIDGEKLRLHEIHDRWVLPRIPALTIHPVPVEPGKSLVIVRDDQSHIGPHQVIASDSYKFHGRNTAGTYTMEVDELRSKILRQASLPERMSDFRQLRIDLMVNRPEDLPTPIKDERKLVVHYLPEQTFGQIGSVNAALFTNRAYSRKVDDEGAPAHAMMGLSPRANIDGYAFMHGRGDDAIQFYAQVFYDGSVEFADSGALGTSNPDFIDHVVLEDTLFRQYRFARKIFAALEIEGRVAILASVLGARKCTIAPKAPTRLLPFVGHDVSIRRDPAFFNPLLIDDMQTVKSVEALEPLIQQVWRACAYSHAYSYKDGKYIGGNW
jgi:hypothetical protein